MRNLSAVIVGGALLALTASAVAGEKEVLLVHGHIYTGNRQTPWVDALAVKGSHIEAAGTSADLLMRYRSHARLIDLKGKTVIPGIIDSHIHTVWGAFALHGFDLSTPERTITPDQPAAIIEVIKTYAAGHPKDVVLFGRADFSTVQPTTPSHDLLDRAVADRPIVILNTSGHAYWLNAAALAAAGITDYPVPDAEEESGVIRDASGHPSGILLEAAMEIAAREILAKVPEEQQLAMLKAATHYLNRLGITGVVNATGDLREVRLFAALRDRGELTVRTRTAFGALGKRHHLTPDFLENLDLARRTYHDRWVSANLVKFFTDGSTGLVPPLFYEPHDYARLVAELDRRGYQIMTHTQRDDGLHLILDAYEQAQQANGARDRRMRIEHVFLSYADDLPRFAKLGIIAAMQPSFCCSDTGSFNYKPEPLPTDQWRTLKDSGAMLAFGSDWPCTSPPNPFVGIEEATTRAIWRSAALANVPGEPFDGAAQAGAVKTGGTFLAAERIGVEDAVDAYTRGSAYAAFFDDWAGTLEVGKEGDLVVLSQDIFAVPHEQIARTQVLLTMVGGNIVYSAPLFDRRR